MLECNEENNICLGAIFHQDSNPVYFPNFDIL
jgi:hypothetical protein